MKALKKMDVNKIVRAIEGDAGHALPGLRESLAQAKAGSFSRVHTPEQIVASLSGFEWKDFYRIKRPMEP